MGDGDGATARIDSSLRSAPFRMTCWGAKGDGSPHTRGQRGGMGPRIREDNGGGWVPAYARTTGGGGFPHTRGQRVGVDSRFRLCGGGFFVGGWGWVPSSARTTGGSCLSSWRGEAYRRGDGDGSPHTRGQRVGVDSRFRLCGGGFFVGGWGWVPAPCLRGGRISTRGHGGLGQGDGRFANRPYGRRILSGTGFTPIPRLHEGRL